MRTTCFTKYINEKQLKEYNKIYNIKFNVIKYHEENNQFDDNIHIERIIILEVIKQIINILNYH